MLCQINTSPRIYIVAATIDPPPFNFKVFQVAVLLYNIYIFLLLYFHEGDMKQQLQNLGLKKKTQNNNNTNRIDKNN